MPTELLIEVNVTSSGRLKVVYWTNIPSPYTVERFNAIATAGEMDFEAWFSSRTHPERSWQIDENSWRFAHHYLPALNWRGSSLVLPPSFLSKKRPDVLVTLYAHPAFLAGRSLAEARGVRTAFWLMRTYQSWVPKRRIRERIKRHIFPRVDGILAAGPEASEFARQYGTRPERIHLVPPSVDVRHFANGRHVAQMRRESLRRKLAIRGVTFMYVGRIWAGKGLDDLLDAFAGVQEQLSGEATLLMVGDGVDEASIRRRAATENLNVKFTGFVQKKELPSLFACADVFVFPTLGDPYGLVVDEAMASSLPVISTTAVGEIRERVIDGETGLLVQPRHAEQLKAAMLHLSRDPQARDRMGKAGFDRIRSRTPERWAHDFSEALSRIVSMPRARECPGK